MIARPTPPASQKPPELSILVVSYRTRRLTLECLESIYKQEPGFNYEVIVVDNASGDGSAEAIREAFPKTRLIASEENLGFAAANNLAADQARGRYLLLLNPDTVLQAGCLRASLACAKRHPEAGVIGARTFFGDGRLNPTSVYGRPSLWGVCCKGLGLVALGRRSRWLNPESLGGWARDSEREVDLVNGCFMLIQTDVWREVEGFDTSFFMYAEDWDLCLRIRGTGRTCHLCPDACLVHYGGASEPVRGDKMTRLFVANAQLFRKHWSPWKAFIGVRLLDAWAWTRMVGYTGKQRLLGDETNSTEAWRSVWDRRRLWREPPRGNPRAEPTSF
ncbi:MAG: glycosyltransferase family 2 protein [Planctomycetota bacterium]